MGAYDEFRLKLLAYAPAVILRPLPKKQARALGEALQNLLFQRPGPRRIQRVQTRREHYLGTIFFGFLEIQKSLDNLVDIETYMRGFPYSRSSISRSRYLQYHIETYLNENYILKSRLQAYLKVILRAHKGDPRRSKLASLIPPLSDTINKAFSGLASTRGLHVHAARYSDDDLDRLEAWELLANPTSEAEDVAMYDLLYHRAYREVRKKWLGVVKANNANVKLILDRIFAPLRDNLFNKKGALRTPKTFRGA